MTSNHNNRSRIHRLTRKTNLKVNQTTMTKNMINNKRTKMMKMKKQKTKTAMRNYKAHMKRKISQKKKIRFTTKKENPITPSLTGFLTPQLSPGRGTMTQKETSS